MSTAPTTINNPAAIGMIGMFPPVCGVSGTSGIGASLTCLYFPSVFDWQLYRLWFITVIFSLHLNLQTGSYRSVNRKLHTPSSSTAYYDTLNKTRLIFCQFLLFLHRKKSLLTKQSFQFLLYLFAIFQFSPNILHLMIPQILHHTPHVSHC